MAYAGYQFGAFVPRLGDGRAILLGEVVDRDGVRRDIQLKGSGPTPFSRRGDGRAALGPVLREYIGRRCVRLTLLSSRANHLVEETISAAVNNGDFSPFESLLTVLSMPYEDQPAFDRYADPPRPDQVVHQTFAALDQGRANSTPVSFRETVTRRDGRHSLAATCTIFDVLRNLGLG